jgi:bacteriocin-like protein
MQKLMSAKLLSKKELKTIKGGAVGCCPVGGNANPPKGGNRECGDEPTYCYTSEWEIWRNCVGKDYPYPYSCTLFVQLI